jgi:hypothetical protein
VAARTAPRCQAAPIAWLESVNAVELGWVWLGAEGELKLGKSFARPPAYDIRGRDPQ